MLDRPKPQEKEVVVGGVTVRYRVDGPENGRLPLVMVHGTAGSIDGHYGYLFPMMAYRQRVIALEFAEPEGETLELDQLVAQVQAVIDAERPGKPVALMGYSLGAVVAAATAALLGKRIENLILIAGWQKTDTHQLFRNKVWKALRNDGSASLTEYMTFCAFSPAFMNIRTVDDMAAAAGMLNVTPFVEKQMDLNTRIDIAAAVETITARTLVIGCTSDMMVPKHHSKALFGSIPDARYTEVPSGHAVVHERPAELFYHIDNFTRLPGTHPAGTIIPAQKP
ncbi:hypothetical protein ACO34A_22685 (plasmid) [Rhizobium sp. ACO-34A]|nr:alpha/beta hydrolase [Rhizobium sp. ACO-34A]ATN36598.1 hypothetical protein ACO34A_22685 [Rhizobium sp. ACO-34A]